MAKAESSGHAVSTGQTRMLLALSVATALMLAGALNWALVYLIVTPIWVH